MAGFITDKDRKVIPRWRTLDDSVKYRELNAVAPPSTNKRITSDYLAQKKFDWQSNQTVGHASDFVGAALTLGKKREAIKAAEYLLQDNLNVSHWARELAEQTLRTSDGIESGLPKPVALEASNLYAQVRIFRHLLRVESRDPITWVELSRVYAILGLEKQAKRSMDVALQLGGDNRFVLRSASRLWMHFDNPERAHYIIVTSNRTRYEPWLLAAEIAISGAAERKPRFIKAARRMLTERSFSSIHLSELAAAVATLDLKSGSVNKSKKFFKLSLEDPTENSIAQVAWASRQSNAIHFRDGYLSLPNAHEAKSWVHYQKGEWRESLEQCNQWGTDQPFSSRPSALGSFVAAVALEEYQTSEQLAKLGQRANPSDFTLLNNLAYARINLGNVDGAKAEISKANRMSLTERDKVVLQATKGFFEFRTGNAELGRQLYSDARLMAKKIEDDRLYALASAFYAIEEVSHQSANSITISSKVRRILKREKDPIFRVLENKLTTITAKLHEGHKPRT